MCDSWFLILSLYWVSSVQLRNLKHTANGISAVFEFRSIANLLLGFFFSCFFAGQAVALSQGCTAVNSMWGNGLTATNQEASGDTYTLFVGEKLSWTATYEGSGTINNNAAASIAVDGNFVLNKSNENGNTPISSSIVIFGSAKQAEININATDGNPSDHNKVTLQVTCTAASSTATLSSLSVSSGSLSPSFSSNITDYTTSVANSVSSITVTPSATDPNSTITVNGTSATSPVSLAVGSKTITVIVTPEYGATKTYTITVTRAAPQPPAIASISPNSGSSSGGTAVTITGADLSNVTSVKFGTTAASSFAVISATSITATTPAHTVGAVDVVVSDGTNTSTLSNAFTYEPALSFSPAAGTLTATNVGANYRQTITTSGGT